MSELLDLFPLSLFFILFWKSHRVPFNRDYLSLSASKYFKGWFCLVIVLHHLSQWTTGGVLFRPFTAVGYLAVAVFFFFSSFGTVKQCMTNSNYSRHFLQRRLPALFVPYFVASAFYIFLQNCYGEYRSLWPVFWPWEDGTPILPHSWYIFSIFLFYVYSWVMMRLCKRNWVIMMVGMCVYYFLYTFFCLAMEYGPWWTISSAALLMGTVCAWKEKSITRFLEVHKKYISILLLLGIQIVLWQEYLRAFMPYQLAFCNIISCSVVGTLLVFSACWRLNNNILSFLSNIYLEIYLMHGIFIWIVPMRRPNTILSNEFIWCCAVLIGSIGGGYLLHLLCQKPLQVYKNWLKQH